MTLNCFQRPGWVAGLTVAFSILTAPVAQAAKVFDFTVHWSDDSIGSGSFSIDDTPDLIADGEGYSGRSWLFSSDFTYSHAGKTYTSPLYGSYAFYRFAPGEASTRFGSFVQGFQFELTERDPWIYVEMLRGENGYGYVDGFTDYAISPVTLSPVNITLTERKADVPEPSLLIGLSIATTGVLLSQRKAQRHQGQKGVDAALSMQG